LIHDALGKTGASLFFITAMQILMSDGIKENPSKTLVHDGFFSSYSVFGYSSVKTGRL